METVEHLHRYADRLTGWLIYFMLIFSPWAFGTTQPWAIWVMNSTAYAIGLLMTAKWITRWSYGISPPRFGAIPPERSVRLLIRSLAGLTILLLGWCLVSAANASASYSAKDFQFIYRQHLAWLPHSFDAPSSWHWFWIYLGFACFFWGTRDWLLTRSDADPRSGEKRGSLPVRLQTLLWVISVNGALIGIEGLLQRVDNSGKLLWLVQPRVNPGAASQFGPYAYRSNAVQFLNLIWPVTLGFWFVLNRRYRAAKRPRPTHHLLLSAVMVMAACPLLSDSRAGAVVMLGLLAMSALILVVGLTEETWIVRATPALLAVATVALGLNMGWDSLKTRMRTIEVDYQLREQIYETARKMATDYKWFGTGPGTFDPLFQMYRRSPDEYWPAQLHNDWLESRITFGGIGFGLILASLGCAAFRWFLGGGIGISWVFPAFLWVSLSGCLLHARFDFPFQIYSILLMFLLNSLLLFCVSRRASGS